MLNRLVIPDAPTFENGLVELRGLKSVNYIFGANGSGKTTISRFLKDHSDDPASLDLPHDCRVEVYNCDFVKDCLRQESIPGVFTLGEDASLYKERLEDIQQEISELSEDSTKKQGQLDGTATCKGLYPELEEEKDILHNACWESRKTLNESYKKAFRGSLTSKERFADALLNTHASPDDRSHLPADLDRLLEEVASNDEIALGTIAEPDLKRLTEDVSSALVGECITGNTESSLNDLILFLKNSSWVNQGIEYLEQLNEKLCPFCQRKLDEHFLTELGRYFDNRYESKIQQLAAFRDWCNEAIRSLDDLMYALDIFPYQHPALLSTKQASENIRSLICDHIDIVNRKLAEPERRLSFPSNASSAIKALRAALNELNEEVQRHNDSVKNRAQLRENVFASARLSVACRHVEALKRFEDRTCSINAGIAGIKSKIDANRNKIIELREEREQIENMVTSTKPTVDKINALLLNSGFTNFSIQQAGCENSYQLVREDGSLAHHTLSEGESTFIAFLYFYATISGSLSETGVLVPRVVVIDDPISSLDSSVLFTVSVLVRQLAQQARDRIGAISQLIVLTHNTAFHREITYTCATKDGEKYNSTAFYVIRKSLGVSSIVEHGDKNPIRSSYEALWRELVQEDNAITVRNSMRRILETYFGLVGGLNVNATINQLEDDQKEAGRSLLLWAHSGSHDLFDDLEYIEAETTVEAYLSVLKLIFECNGQAPHYEIMAQKYGLPL